MMMQTPTDILRDEHRVILAALDLLEGLLDQPDPPSEAWGRLVDWLRAFADRNHHVKEEQALFPALVRAGVPSEGGPIDVMLAEHTHARALVHAMETAYGAERAIATRGYIALLRDHIDKENGVLFPIAESALDAAATTAVRAEFSRLASALGADADLAAAECGLDVIAAMVYHARAV